MFDAMLAEVTVGALLIATASGAGPDPRPSTLTPAMAEASLREVRASHPRDYVAALIEVVGDGDCKEAGPGEPCAIETDIVELFDGRYPPGGKLASLSSGPRKPGSSTAHERVLVVAVPMPEKDGVYAWKLAIVRPTEGDVEALREAAIRNR